MKTSKKIADYLISRDKNMKKVIGSSVIIARNIESDGFYSLVDTIISQQISGKAAETICNRLKDRCGGQITVDKLQALSDEEMRELGVSSYKIKYLRSLCDAVITKEIDFSKLNKLKDEEIIGSLVRIKGIGYWSAEMFLIFSLGRKDIFSCGDLALQKAVNHWYFNDEIATKQQLLQVSEKWAPYRTYASLYLWESIRRF